VIRLATILVIVFLAQHATAAELPAVRYIRAYGGNDERRPPVLILESSATAASTSIGDNTVTAEFDISHPNIPNIFARLIHCGPDWQETSNGFLNDVTNRTLLFDWTLAPARSRWHTYRGKITLPNPQLQVRFSGNWLLRLVDMDTEATLAETRFFAVQPMLATRMNFFTEFYEPKVQVSGAGLLVEAIVQARTAALIDGFQNTTVFYRNNRWFEPYPVSTQRLSIRLDQQIGASQMGMLTAGKVYRVGPIPAENEYRILDLANTALFPSTGSPVRIPMSDLRRLGNFQQRADDGAMVTSFVSGADDEYIPVEILLDPMPGPTNDDVFLVGSFNNWKPDRTWQMSYDETMRLYRLRQWFRRGRHNYMYATGKVNADDGTVQELRYEQFEGNTASAGHGFLAFAYYRVQDFGGYDGIIGVASSNIYQSGR